MSTDAIAWPSSESLVAPLCRPPARMDDDRRSQAPGHHVHRLCPDFSRNRQASKRRSCAFSSFVRINDFVSPQVFNRMFTMHGTTMIFFVAMPLVFGFANYLVPLMIGARDMAFPRLNAFSFWMTAFGGLLLYFSLVGANGLYGAGNAPDVGWWAYAPLTSPAFSPGHSTDFWTMACWSPVSAASAPRSTSWPPSFPCAAPA